MGIQSLEAARHGSIWIWERGERKPEWEEAKAWLPLPNASFLCIPSRARYTSFLHLPTSQPAPSSPVYQSPRSQGTWIHWIISNSSAAAAKFGCGRHKRLLQVTFGWIWPPSVSASQTANVYVSELLNADRSLDKVDIQWWGEKVFLKKQQYPRGRTALPGIQFSPVPSPFGADSFGPPATNRGYFPQDQKSGGIIWSVFNH